MIAITSDIDWAPDEVIQDTVDLFQKYNVKCTLFCTHDTNVIKKSNRDLFEIAIHPNFNNTLNGSSNKRPDEIIEEIFKIYPEAEGVRSHSLTNSTPLLNLFSKVGFKYVSNTLIPYSNNIEITKLWNNMVSIPINWEDDVHMMYENSFENSKLQINQNNLNVFNFHPIHVYLNTEKISDYENAKRFYNAPKKLKEHVNTKTIGTRDFLINLLEKCKKQKLVTYKMNELINN